MIYEPNTTVWRPWDIVIHDSDAKTSKMLMRVEYAQKDGLLVTRYVDAEMQDEARRRWGTSKLINAIHLLHDPQRFAISVPWDVTYPPERLI